LSNVILHADDEAEMHRLLSPLTAEETEMVAQLVEMAAMKACAERERRKPFVWVRRSTNSPGAFCGGSLCDIPSFGEAPE
jgi:hypothetical protein